MKKFLTICSLLAVSYIAKSQNNFRPGFKAGVNLNTWTAQVEGIGFSTGFYAGGMVRLPVSKCFSFVPEILFSSEGSKVPGGKNIDHYIKLPLMAQFTHASGLHVETGPQIGVLVKAKLKLDHDEEIDAKELHQKIEIGWGMGLGYTLPMGMGVNLRYNKGLTGLGTGEIKITSNVISAGVHYMF